MAESDRPVCSTGSTKSSSTEEGDGPLHEEAFVDRLTSQIDANTIDEILSVQRRTLVAASGGAKRERRLCRLDRFEKTNEMLATCRTLAQKRLEEAKRQFESGRDLITQAKADLESSFQRLRNMKMALAERNPEIYVEQGSSFFSSPTFKTHTFSAMKVDAEFPTDPDDS